MSRGKILFADDELHYIEALLEIANAEGYEVVTCRQAADAVALVQAGDIACVVLDIMMDPGNGLAGTPPHEAGLTAVDRILQIKNHPPIICLSVISDQTIINGLKRHGVLYLRKAETSVTKAWDLIESKITGIYRAK